MSTRVVWIRGGGGRMSQKGTAQHPQGKLTLTQSSCDKVVYMDKDPRPKAVGRCEEVENEFWNFPL